MKYIILAIYRQYDIVKLDVKISRYFLLRGKGKAPQGKDKSKRLDAIGYIRSWEVVEKEGCQNILKAFIGEYS
jgi:hypothetical protein